MTPSGPAAALEFFPGFFGVLIDSLHRGMMDVYVTEPRRTISVAPLVTGGRVGARAAIRW